MKIELNFPEEITEPCISPEFIQGMLDRMAVSHFKYGPVTPEDTAHLNFRETLRVRWERYEETGNTEWLMDVANYAMMEFMCPKHPNAHFRDTDSDESPGRIGADGQVTYEHSRDLQ